MTADHSEFIRCLRMLASDYGDWLNEQVTGEQMMRTDAESKIHEAYVHALRTIGKLAPSDPIAREFIDRGIASITQPYSFDDMLGAARQLAPVFLKRLLAEQEKEQEDARRDPIGLAQRQYLKARSDYDPFCKNANVMVSGLASPAKTRVTTDPLGGILEQD